MAVGEILCYWTNVMKCDISKMENIWKWKKKKCSKLNLILRNPQ